VGDNADITDGLEPADGHKKTVFGFQFSVFG
jgi:hypothetical protein